MTRDRNLFAEKVLSLRTARGLTQRALAARIRTSQTTVSFWENGHKVPSPRVVQRIARALQWDSVDLLLRAEGAIVDAWRRS